MVHYVAHNPEAQLGPKIIPGLNEFALTAVGVKNACLSVSVDGQVVDRMLPKKLDFPAGGLYYLMVILYHWKGKTDVRRKGDPSASG